ncbi:hypothetical protein D7Z54_28775 [Salibacterium salarium]|uniref:YesK-like protein n=1 Tax=Salibacterium salarium TaxID=284579 RepID=A0A428MUV5_9BACI|nr:hypothetical protein D7Z54_28775 [Salibacterium salarium]
MLAITVLIILSALLIIKWKQWYPYSIPLGIILGGLYYQLFYLLFTVGWVGLQGIIGLAIALVTGIILMIYYLVSKYIKGN